MHELFLNFCVVLVSPWFLSLIFFVAPAKEQACFKEAAALGRVFYRQHVDRELFCDKDKNGPATLWFNAYESVYVHDSFPRKSAILGERGNEIILQPGDKEGFPIYMNVRDGEIIFKRYLGLEPEASVIHDTLPEITWELLDFYKEIGGYRCQRAEGEFAGRLYEAWFTREIPVPFGPYKLWGLPGLILEASDELGLVRFEFAGLELFASPEQEVLKPVKGRRHFQSYEEYWRAAEERRINMNKEARAEGSGFRALGPTKDCSIEIY